MIESRQIHETFSSIQWVELENRLLLAVDYGASCTCGHRSHVDRVTLHSLGGEEPLPQERSVPGSILSNRQALMTGESLGDLELAALVRGGTYIRRLNRFVFRSVQNNMTQTVVAVDASTGAQIHEVVLPEDARWLVRFAASGQAALVGPATPERHSTTYLVSTETLAR